MKYSNFVGKIGLATVLSMTHPWSYADSVPKFTLETPKAWSVTQEFEEKVTNCLNGITMACILPRSLGPQERVYAEQKGLKIEKADITTDNRTQRNVEILMKYRIPHSTESSGGNNQDNTLNQKGWNIIPECRKILPNIHIDSGVASYNGQDCR